MEDYVETMFSEYGLTRGQGVRALRATVRPPRPVSAHAHVEHQLLLTGQGSVTVRTDDRAWVVRPGRAAWIPAEHDHDVLVTEPAELTCLYLDPDECPVTPRARVFAAGSLLRGLAAQLLRPDLDDEQACRFRAVLLDLLDLPGSDLVPLPVPVHPGARTVARALLADPADPRHLTAWSDEVFFSARTLQRAFLAETGLTFAAWRARVRLDVAGRLLAEGRTVGAVAPAVGYGSANGLTAAYRRHFGHSPAGA